MRICVSSSSLDTLNTSFGSRAQSEALLFFRGCAGLPPPGFMRFTLDIWYLPTTTHEGLCLLLLFVFHHKIVITNFPLRVLVLQCTSQSVASDPVRSDPFRSDPIRSDAKSSRIRFSVLHYKILLEFVVSLRVDARYGLLICSGPRHIDTGIVGMVHAHDLDASTAVCGLVGEML